MPCLGNNLWDVDSLLSPLPLEPAGGPLGFYVVYLVPCRQKGLIMCSFRTWQGLQKQPLSHTQKAIWEPIPVLSSILA